MFRITLQKMWHKKWMNLSLLVGCILLVATVVSFPLYEKAAYDRMLQDEFINVMSKDSGWPTLNSMSTAAQKDKKGTIQKIEKFAEGMYEELGVTPNQTILFYYLTKSPIKSDMNREDASGLEVRLCGMSDLENHIDIMTGEPFSATGLDEDGRLEVLVSDACLIQQGFLLGETLTFDSLKTPDGGPLSVVIKGVFTPKSKSDYYWQVKASEMTDAIFVNMDVFREMFTTKEHAAKYNINCRFFSLFEYNDITYDQVNHIMDQTTYLTKESKYRSVIDTPEYIETLENYLRKINRISATLVILQIPVLIMLCAFLLMISGQMYEMERNEISVIKSRGSSRGQIFLLYLFQSLALTLAGGAVGIPLGMVFSRILGATRNFLEFDLSQSLKVSFTDKALYYSLAAMLLTMMSMTLPAIKHSKVSIVNLKQQKAIKKKSLWEKLFLDIILLGVSIYGYYSFNKNMSDLSTSVLAGESLDPLLYISSSLFILGAGLLFLRLQPYLIQLIYNIGKRRWKPANYISFLENIKNGRKQQLIMLFLIMTVSLGIFHATVARTILDNAVENTKYLDASQIALKESWPVSHDVETGAILGYVEPDYTKFLNMEFAQDVTKVLLFDNAYVSAGKNDNQIITLMGIHTKEFGTLTTLNKSLNEKPYREYLNELAVKADGLIVSSNFKSVLGYDIGDTVTFCIDSTNKGTGKIVDFVDFWPGYAPSVNDLNPDGTAFTRDNYLVVGHFDHVKQAVGTQPCEVWFSLREGYDGTDVYKWIDDKNLSVKKYVNKDVDVENTIQDPLLQGTNGVLTMGFVVTILLCAIGYLIYWIMAIRERELMFGVLRACGFHKGELVRMLINEQIFCGLLSVLSGIGIGKLTSKMFVPILQQAYSSENQVLPMRLITDATDMARLYTVIALSLVVALLVLVVILFRMNVAKALKLGEE